VTRLALRHLLRRSFRDDLAAAISGVRAEVNHPVRAFDDVEVVFDDEDGMAGVHEALENLKQHANVVEVQAGGGFVEEKQSSSIELP
jgi:hypothetical protein